MVENKWQTHNIGFAKWRAQCFYDNLVQGSSSVFQLYICAENPPLRKAENCCTKGSLRSPSVQRAAAAPPLYEGVAPLTLRTTAVLRN